MQLTPPQKIYMKIRTIQPQDNNQLNRIITQCAEEFNLIGEGYGPSDPEVSKMFEAYHRPGFSYLVIESDKGEILGGAGIGKLIGAPNHWCELRKMYLDPSARKRGYGRQLLTALLTIASKDHYTVCYLETTAILANAIRLYENYGFIRLSEPISYSVHSSCEVAMVMDPII
ncbi:MAG: GNAT family N-acetyltransferase [Zetaproteobacteria bacterium]|nr:GNAT family N-acetyltransferase [Pseudobdellovibrionaceae bacterium]